MSIEKTYFDITNTKLNVASIVSWLEANATEYFDSFTSPDDKTLNCELDNTARLVVTILTSGHVSNTCKITTSYGNNNDTMGNIRMPGYNIAVPLFQYGIKTSSGIVLYADNNHIIYFTKSNRDSTCVYTHWKGAYFQSSNNSSSDMIIHNACDLINSRYVSGTSSNFSGYSIANYTSSTYIKSEDRYYWSSNKSYDITAFVPFCFDTGTYTPNMFITPFSQYAGQVGIIAVDNTRYFYDGYVALKE